MEMTDHIDDFAENYLICPIDAARFLSQPKIFSIFMRAILIISLLLRTFKREVVAHY